jgi:hypothetical protein
MPHHSRHPHHDQPYDPSRDFIVFHHVPKCGGTSLHGFLSSVLGTNGYIVPTGDDMQSLDISSLRGLGGHHYNYHKKIYENKHLNYIKILIARDPLERMFSLYSHVMRFPSSHQIALAHPSRDLSGMSFGDFALFCAEFSIRDATNMTARFICGNQGDPYRVDRVLEILDSQFRFAYPLQLSNLLYQDLGHYLGAPQKTIDEYALKIRLNKSPTRHRNPQMIAEAAPTILSSNSVDYMIYSHICKRYSNVTNRSNILIKEIADKIRSIREN